MTNDEALRDLGVLPNANVDTITAVHHETVKPYHPDCHEDPEAMDAVPRAYQACPALPNDSAAQITSDRLPPNDEDVCDPAADAEIDEAEGGDAVPLVRTVMRKNDLFILFDSSIRVGNGPCRGYGPGDEEAWLARPGDWNVSRLSDATMDEVNCKSLDLSVSDVKRALRNIIRCDQHNRINSIMKPLLFDGLNAPDHMQAGAEWLKLASATFDSDPVFSASVLQHFVWQVKRKLLELPVCHHLMPVVVSSKQGSGKTTFVRAFLSPLEELASSTALLSDFADPRSGDILEFPVVFIDDVGRLDPRQNAALKSLLTADTVSRRQLGTSLADKRRQRATLIGTANEPINVLISDPTGHRRFVELPFRNGAISEGGDAEVWRAVDETDYALLWRSVDGFGPSPITSPPCRFSGGAGRDSACGPHMALPRATRYAIRSCSKNHRTGRRPRR